MHVTPTDKFVDLTLAKIVCSSFLQQLEFTTKIKYELFNFNITTFIIISELVKCIYDRYETVGYFHCGNS